MYVQLDKKKPCTGNTRGLNLAAVRLATVQVSNCRLGGLSKLRHNLLYNKPALTEVSVYIRIQCQFVFLCIVYIRYISPPQSPSEYCDPCLMMVKYVDTYLKRPTPPLFEEEVH
jgi:hypothetical protein